MTDLTRVPFRTPSGQMRWEDFAAWFETWQREVAGKQDARNPNSDFATGLVANDNGSVTLGTAYPEGRTATVKDLTQKLTDAGRAADQRFLPIVSAGNKLSVQTTNPITSTGSASTASIAIAAHVVQYGFGTVSYNAGSITGLSPLTSYYVYADDPTYAGGAVSYSATTTPATIVASNNRYFVGAVTTANSTPTGNITGVTNANPCVVTVTAHPFVTGNSVTFSGVGGTTQLNGNTYVITKISANTFSLDGIDSTAYGVYTSGGTATRVSSGTTGGSGGGWGDPLTSIP